MLQSDYGAGITVLISISVARRHNLLEIVTVGDRFSSHFRTWTEESMASTTNIEQQDRIRTRAALVVGVRYLAMERACQI